MGNVAIERLLSLSGFFRKNKVPTILSEQKKKIRVVHESFWIPRRHIKANLVAALYCQLFATLCQRQLDSIKSPGAIKAARSREEP